MHAPAQPPLTGGDYIDAITKLLDNDPVNVFEVLRLWRIVEKRLHELSKDVLETGLTTLARMQGRGDSNDAHDRLRKKIRTELTKRKEK
jgi:hypothetical protein